MTCLKFFVNVLKVVRYTLYIFIFQFFLPLPARTRRITSTHRTLGARLGDITRVFGDGEHHKGVKALHICLLIDNPRYATLPIVGEVMESLESAGHSTRLLNVLDNDGGEIAQHRADIYLLKSHGPDSLAYARKLEEKGALVINSAASTGACQDRIMMTRLMTEANLPWPKTWFFSSLGELLANEQQLSALPYPLIVKSQQNNTDTELVERIESPEQFSALAARWSQEAVIVQEWLEGDGWDTKVWVIGDEIFAARRRSPLDRRPKDQFQLFPNEIDEVLQRISLEIGEVFGLSIFGVDFLTTKDGFVAMDVNSFPGLRNLIGPEKAIVKLVERLGARTAV